MSLVAHTSDDNKSIMDDDIDNEGEKKREATPEPDNERNRSRAKAIELVNVERANALLHISYAQKDYPNCKALIGELIEQYQGECEYPIFIRGIIAREEGDLEEALEWMKRAQKLAPNEPKHLLHIGRIYFLMGKHTNAVEYLEKAVKADKMNYKCYYWLSRAVYHLDTNLFDPTDKAKDILLNAPVLHQSSELLIFLAKLFTQLRETLAAIQTFKKALELEPENLDIMVHLGMLYLRTNSEDPAFAMFGRALSFDPTHADSILAAGSVMQSHGDHDVALNKYRVAAEKCDYNGCLWNNIGMCLYAKGKYVAAISCLKKAAYLCPLEYRINYNLGLVHNAMQQYCSAYHFLAAALALNPKSAQILGTLAVVLSNMKDDSNARKAYERALEMDNDPQINLNYAIFETKRKNFDAAQAALNRFREETQEKRVTVALRSLADRVQNALLEHSQSSPSTDIPSDPTDGHEQPSVERTLIIE